MAPNVRVAACHVSPIFLSAIATTYKVLKLIEEAAHYKANVVIFPETYIPAFPIWSALRPPTDNHEFFKDMALESIYADGPEMKSIRRLAKQLNIIVSIGFSEKVRFSSATLYNSNMIISGNGDVLVHHRKLMPTFFEKLTWSPGDGHGLRTADTPFGKIGNLICGENTNPLARYTLMAQGEQLHISTWPAIWPTRTSKPQTESAAETSGTSTVAQGADYDNVAANRVRAAAHCFEAKCFGVMCAGKLGQDAIDAISSDASPIVLQTLEQAQQGATMFLDPTGAPLRGFIFEDGTAVPKDLLQNEEGILYADIDLDDCIEGKQYHDVVGGYQRLDVFDLKVDRTRRHPINFVEIQDSASSQAHDNEDTKMSL
ncbi:carbon-nitrogen hydrolase [Aaosphaeria arxii CBS 175.79]|uniref:Carbon-nitrogen hydrolase n=1 Tax=Aaosphaeria arxii CBS 175.79 TaxID=1450172 RepID=A0A6A5XVI3_9PLEO|nr:carbon-nitrogen hydrolase [Aaosphaeria arxii CBS 175.79]KAF2016721.1 carbon-nitrogen hydrolase [Aaosphaeria arxii CBS 175.79]